MPKLAKDYNYSSYGYSYTYTQSPITYEHKAKLYYYPVREKAAKVRTKKRNPLRFLFSSIVILAFLIMFMPYSFNMITKSVFNPNPYKNITTDTYELIYPTTNYLSNNWFMGQRRFDFASEGKNAQMVSMIEGVNMPSLQGELLKLMEAYPTIKPSIYVWDYATQNYIDINATKVYPVASIIKIPVLIDLFKSIENGTISLQDTIPLTEYYRTEGSGQIQYKASGSLWTIDKLANEMITDSDNSATNMLMSKLGAMDGVNSSIRDWGLKNTEIKTWLPDMTGNNHSTAKEMAQMLYNIDSNEEFLTDSSRNKIFDYMSRVHNDRLIQAGLGNGSTFYHKTGDIGTMLGDAGIVVTPNGARYIVVILANRPHNSFAGKEFIVKASEIIYNYMVR